MGSGVLPSFLAWLSESFVPASSAAVPRSSAPRGEVAASDLGARCRSLAARLAAEPGTTAASPSPGCRRAFGSCLRQGHPEGRSWRAAAAVGDGSCPVTHPVTSTAGAGAGCYQLLPWPAASCDGLDVAGSTVGTARTPHPHRSAPSEAAAAPEPVTFSTWRQGNRERNPSLTRAQRGCVPFPPPWPGSGLV